VSSDDKDGETERGFVDIKGVREEERGKGET